MKFHCKLFDINSDMSYMCDIIDLAKQFSQTIGFLTFDAYSQFAEKRNILIAIGEKEIGFCGFLIFAKSYSDVRIVQLAIKSHFQGKGLAHELIRELEKNIDGCYSIKLSCRQDFTVNSVWPRLGFVNIGSRPGRSVSGTTLSLWKKTLIPDLLDLCASSVNSVYASSRKHNTVIDSNIAIAIIAQISNPDSCPDNYKRSLILLNNWLLEQVDYYLCHEGVEFVKCPEGKSIEDYGLSYLPEPTDSNCQDVYNDLIKIITDNSFKHKDNDIKLLSKAISSSLNIQFFITEDRGILRYRDIISDKYDLLIIDPVEFVQQVDSIINENDYCPRRLSGITEIEVLPTVNNYNVQELFERFSEQHEKLTDFKNQMQLVFAGFQDPFSCVVVSEGKLLALVTTVENEDIIKIPMIRFLNNKLGRTLVSHIINNIVVGKWCRKSSQKMRVVEICDTMMSPALSRVAQDSGFYASKNSLIKISANRIVSSIQINNNLELLADKNKEIKESVNTYLDILASSSISNNKDNSQNIANLEAALFPCFINDAGIQNWIIPIKPSFAREMFDSDLADVELFNFRKHLLLSNENIYYRTYNLTQVIKAPSRIFWYYSADSNSGKRKSYKSQTISAVSRLVQVDSGSPQELFSKYSRYGIYNLDQIESIARSANKVMALRFKDTLIFKDPLELKNLKNIVNFQNEIKLNLLRPERISEDFANKILRNWN